MSLNPPPVVYRNSRAAAIFYAVPFRLAQQRLEGTGLFAVRIGNYGIVNATWFDYAETSIGPYREFSLGIVASPEQHRFRLAVHLISGLKGDLLGSFVLALPVDSEPARAGGVQHFSLPKSLVQFRIDWSNAQLAAAIESSGGPIVSMVVPLRMGVPIRIRRLTIFSRHRGQLMTTQVNTQWPAKLDLVGRPTLAISNPHHPIGHELVGLELDTAPVLAVVHGPLQYAALPVPPPRVADWTSFEGEGAGPSTVRSRTE